MGGTYLGDFPAKNIAMPLGDALWEERMVLFNLQHGLKPSKSKFQCYFYTAKPCISMDPMCHTIIIFSHFIFC
jgi:hypothetical protein